jgi:hypothetical protein
MSHLAHGRNSHENFSSRISGRLRFSRANIVRRAGSCMRFYWFLLGTLGVWRITHLLSAEDGPWNVIVWIRRKAADGFWANLLDCFYCLSLWVALPFAFFIGDAPKEKFCLWLAFSASAILLERATSNDSPPTVYFDHGGREDGMLRESQSPTSGDNLQRKNQADTESGRSI